MASIIVHSEFSHNIKHSFPQVGSTDIIEQTIIEKDTPSKQTAIPNYSFLAYDGRILSSGLDFQQAQYDKDELVVTIGDGIVGGPTRTNIAAN